jgi:hypothetical protein
MRDIHQRKSRNSAGEERKHGRTEKKKKPRKENEKKNEKKTSERALTPPPRH